MLRDFVLFLAGARVGLCPRVPPPVLETLYEEIPVSGRSAPIEVPTGVAALTMEVVMKGVGTAAAKLWGLGSGDPQSLLLRGVTRATDGSQTRCQIEVTGVIGRVDPGNWDSARRAETETTLMVREISFYKRTDGDVITTEYDVENDVLVVAGVDRNEARRQLLGI